MWVLYIREKLLNWLVRFILKCSFLTLMISLLSMNEHRFRSFLTFFLLFCWCWRVKKRSKKHWQRQEKRNKKGKVKCYKKDKKFTSLHCTIYKKKLLSKTWTMNYVNCSWQFFFSSFFSISQLTFFKTKEIYDTTK